jgi:hypothetical protein
MKIEDFTQGSDIVGTPASEFPDEGWVLPRPHLSVSQLKAFMQCERAYQQSYILEDKAPSNPDFVLGSAVHGAIGFALMHPDFNPTESAGYFSEYAWPNAIEDQKTEIDWRKDDPDQVRIRGAQMVEAYVREVVPRIELSELEKRIELDIPGIPVPIIGFIDITQKGSRPAIDIKTQGDKQTTVRPEWLLQGRVYQLAEEKPIDWHVITKQVTTMIYTAADSPGLFQPYSEVQAERTKDLLVRLAWRMNHAYAMHGLDEDWDWTGLSHPYACKRCHWKGRCPGWEGV